MKSSAILKRFSCLEDFLERIVALKFLNADTASTPQWRKGVLQEGKALSTLEHENIVKVYRLGIWQGASFISMELLQGRSLSSAIADDGSFNVEQTVQIGIQICQAMAFAHDHNIVHRDLKPANVFLVEQTETERESVKILDLGLASITDGAQSKTQALTQTGVLIGFLSTRFACHFEAA